MSGESRVRISRMGEILRVFRQMSSIGWRPRFSLRTLLVLMTVVSVGLAWYVERVRVEQRAAEAVLAAGGEVIYDWQMRPADADGSFRRDPPGPDFLRAWFGPHWFDSIVKVELNGNQFRRGKDNFKLLSSRLIPLPTLRELRLWMVPLDQGDFELLGRMQQLQMLSIGQVAEMTPENAAGLSAARNLQALHLDYAKVFPPTLSELAKLPRLEKLRIICDNYDRRTGKHIDLYDLDDESAAAIGDFPRLRELSLHYTKITDQGLADLCELSQLELLVVSSPRITSASFEPVSRLKRLRHLGTWAWKIEDADFAMLQDAPQLTSLGLVTPLTNASVVELCKLKQLKRLNLDGDKITDESLAHLRQLPKLEWLYMRDSGVDKLSSVSQEFVRALPDCVIVLPYTAKEKEMDRAFHASKYRW